MTSIRQWIAQNPAIAAALIGVCGVLIGGFFTVVVWPFFRTSFGKAWDLIWSLLAGKRYEHKYLDWAIGEHQYLPTLPTTLVPVTTGRHRQELDKLYVSLGLISEKGKSEVQLSAAIRDHQRLIILGDPGSGKTTMLHFLALTFARARRARSSAATPQQRREARLRMKAAKGRVKDEFGFSTCPLPIFVYLNRLRNIGEWPKSYSLLDALRDDLKSVDVLRNLPDNFFEDKLNAGDCIFLLDAFDELGSPEARQAVARAVGELSNSAPGNRFVVTSRIVGYSGQLSQYGFDVIEVQRLTWDMIRQLVTSWYDSLEEPALADHLLLTLKNNPRIYELAVNPMLLSLIALVQYVKRLIPDRRHVLYDECVKILVERRYAPPLLQEHYNKTVPGEEAIRILQRVASEMHAMRVREVPREQLEDSILSDVLKAMPNSRAAAHSPGVVLANIEERSQLLLERGLNELGQPLMAFSHLTFQEFLTSAALKESTSTRGEALVSETLIRSYEVDRDWWEEVALLYAAQLDAEQQGVFLNRIYPPNAASSITT